VTTADADLAARMRRLRIHGIDIEADVRHRAGVVIERYVEPGFNMRITDVQAAIGRVQLTRLPGMAARRRALAASYAAGWSDPSWTLDQGCSAAWEPR